MIGPEDNVPPPQRSPDQLVGLIQVKLDRLRRRRRQRFGVAGATAAAIVVIFVASVGIARAGHQPTTVVRTATGGPLGTTSTMATVPTTAGGTVPNSNVAGTTPTTSPVVATTAPHPQSTTITTRPPAPNPTTTTTTTAATTTTTAVVASCTPSEIRETASTDQTTYVIGQPIVITSTIENISDHACTPPYGDGAGIELAGGTPSGLPVGGGEWETDGTTYWEPGTTQTMSITLGGVNCKTCAPSAAGAYQATFDWLIAYGTNPNPPPATTAVFHVT